MLSVQSGVRLLHTLLSPWRSDFLPRHSMWTSRYCPANHIHVYTLLCRLPCTILLSSRFRIHHIHIPNRSYRLSCNSSERSYFRSHLSHPRIRPILKGAGIGRRTRRPGNLLIRSSQKSNPVIKSNHHHRNRSRASHQISRSLEQILPSRHHGFFDACTDSIAATRSDICFSCFL